MTNNYDQSAITQVPAEVSGNSKEDILKHFNNMDELRHAVDVLGPKEFVNRFAYNNEEAGLDIYHKVRDDMQQPEPVRSIYAEQIETKQDPDTYAHFDTDTLSGKVLNAIFGDTSKESMYNSDIKSLVVSNGINSTASIANAFYDTVNAFGANMGRYNTTPEQEQKRRETRQLIEDTAKRMTYGVSPETKNAMVEIKLKQDKTKELEKELSKETDPKRIKELEAQIDALRLNPEELELANDPVFKEVNQLEESMELYNRLSSLSQADSDFWGLNQFKYNNAIENPGSLKDHIFKINKMLADTSGLLVESAVTGTGIGKGLSLARGALSRGFGLGSKAIYAGEEAAVLSGFKPFDPKTWTPATLAIRKGNKVIPAVLKGVKELGVSTAAVLPLSLEEAAENRVDTINNLLNNGLAPGLSTGEETLMLTAAWINDVGTAMLPKIPTLPKALRGSATEVAAARVYNNIKTKWPDITADAFEKAFKSGTSFTKSVRAAIAAESMKVLAEAGKDGITKSGAKAIGNFIGNLTQDSIALGLTTFVQQAIKDFASAGYLRSGDFVENWVDYLSGGDYRRNLQESFEAGLMAIPLAAPSASSRFKKDIDNLSKYSTELKKQAYLNANLWSSDETVEYDKIQDILNKPRVDQATYGNNIKEISEAVSNNDIDSIVNKTGLSREFVSNVLETSTPEDAIVGFTDFLGVTDTKAKKLEEHQADLINQAKEKRDTDSILGKGVRTDSSYTVNNAKRLFKDITKLGSMSNNKAALGELIQTYQQVQNGTMDAKEIGSVLQKYAHLPEVRVLDSMLRRTSNIAFKDADIVANLDRLANKYLKTPTRDNTKLKDSPMDLVFGVDAGKANDFWQLAASGKLSIEDLLKRDKADEAEEQRLKSIKNTANAAEITSKQELIKARRKAYKKLIKWNNDINAVSNNLSEVLKPAKEYAEKTGTPLSELGTVIDKFFNNAKDEKKKGLFNHLTDIFRHYTNNDASNLLGSLHQLGYFINSQSPEVKGINYDGRLKDVITAEHELMKVITKQFLETNGLIKDIEASAKVNNITGPIILAELNKIKGLYEGVNTTYDQFIRDNIDSLSTFTTAATSNSTNNAEERKEAKSKSTTPKPGPKNPTGGAAVDSGKQEQAQEQGQQSSEQPEPKVQASLAKEETIEDIVDNADVEPTSQQQQQEVQNVEQSTAQEQTNVDTAAIRSNPVAAAANYSEVQNTSKKVPTKANRKAAIEENKKHLINGIANYVLSYFPNKSKPVTGTVTKLVERLCNSGLPIDIADPSKHKFTLTNSLLKFNSSYKNNNGKRELTDVSMVVNWIGAGNVIPKVLVRLKEEDLDKPEVVSIPSNLVVDQGVTADGKEAIRNIAFEFKPVTVTKKNLKVYKLYLAHILETLYPEITSDTNLTDIRPAVLNVFKALRSAKSNTELFNKLIGKYSNPVSPRRETATINQAIAEYNTSGNKNKLYKYVGSQYQTELKNQLAAKKNTNEDIYTNMSFFKSTVIDAVKFTDFNDLNDPIGNYQNNTATILGKVYDYAVANNMDMRTPVYAVLDKLLSSRDKNKRLTDSEISNLVTNAIARNDLAGLMFLLDKGYIPLGTVGIQANELNTIKWQRWKKVNKEQLDAFKSDLDPMLLTFLHEGVDSLLTAEGIPLKDRETTINKTINYVWKGIVKHAENIANQSIGNKVANTAQPTAQKQSMGNTPVVNPTPNVVPTSNVEQQLNNDLNPTPKQFTDSIANLRKEQANKPATTTTPTTTTTTTTATAETTNTGETSNNNTVSEPVQEEVPIESNTTPNYVEQIQQGNSGEIGDKLNESFSQQVAQPELDTNSDPSNNDVASIDSTDVSDDSSDIEGEDDTSSEDNTDSIALRKTALTLLNGSEDTKVLLEDDTVKIKSLKQLQGIYKDSDNKDAIVDTINRGKKLFNDVKNTVTLFITGEKAVPEHVAYVEALQDGTFTDPKLPEMVLTKSQILRYTKEAFKAVFPQVDVDNVSLKNGKSITQNFYSLAVKSNIKLQGQKVWNDLKTQFGKILTNNHPKVILPENGIPFKDVPVNDVTIKYKVDIEDIPYLSDLFNSVLNIGNKEKSYLDKTLNDSDENRIKFLDNVEEAIASYIFTNLAHCGKSIDVGTLMQYSGLPAEKSNAEHMSAIMRKHGYEVVKLLKKGGLVGPISTLSKRLGKYIYSNLDKNLLPQDQVLSTQELDLFTMYLGDLGVDLLKKSRYIIPVNDTNIYQLNITKVNKDGNRYHIQNDKETVKDVTYLDDVRTFLKSDKQNLFNKYILGDAYAEKHVSFDGSYKTPKFTEKGIKVPEAMQKAINKYVKPGYAIDNGILDYFTSELDTEITVGGEQTTVRDFFTKWLSDYNDDEAFQANAHMAMENESSLKKLNVFLKIKNPKDYFETTSFSIIAHNRAVIKELLGLKDGSDAWLANKQGIKDELAALGKDDKFRNSYLKKHADEMLADDNRYSYAWFPINPGINYRAFQNGIEINPIANKEFTRYLMYRTPNVLKTNYIKNDLIHGNTVQHIIAYSILQNFDKKPEKKLRPEQFQEATRKLLQSLNENSELDNIVMAYNNANGSFKDVTKEQWDALFAALKKNGYELEHEIQVFNIIKTIAQFTDADTGKLNFGDRTIFKIDGKLVTNFTLAETDGVTNGAAIGLVTTLGLFDPTQASGLSATDWDNLNRIGIFRDGSGITSINEFYYTKDGKPTGKKDMYETLIEKFRFNSLRLSADNIPSISGFNCSNLMQLMFITKYGVFGDGFTTKFNEVFEDVQKDDTFNSKFNEVDITEFKDIILKNKPLNKLDDTKFRHMYEYVFRHVLERNDTKYPFMTFNYAAGVEAITKDLLMNRLIPVALERLAELLKNSKDTKKTLKSFIHKVLGFCIDDNLKNNFNEFIRRYQSGENLDTVANDLGIFLTVNDKKRIADVNNTTDDIKRILRDAHFSTITNELNRILQESNVVTPDKVSAKLIDDLLHAMVPAFTAAAGKPLYDTMMREFPQIKFIHSTATAFLPPLFKALFDIKTNLNNRLLKRFKVKKFKQLPKEVQEAYNKFIEKLELCYKSPLGGSFPLSRKEAQQDLTLGGLAFTTQNGTIYSSLNSIMEELNGAAAMIDQIQSVDSGVATFVKAVVGGAFVDIYDALFTNALNNSEMCRAQNAGFAALTIQSETGIIYAVKRVLDTFFDDKNFVFKVTTEEGEQIVEDFSQDRKDYIARGIAKTSLGTRIADKDYENPPTAILREYARMIHGDYLYNDIDLPFNPDKDHPNNALLQDDVNTITNVFFYDDEKHDIKSANLCIPDFLQDKYTAIDKLVHLSKVYNKVNDGKTFLQEEADKLEQEAINALLALNVSQANIRNILGAVEYKTNDPSAQVLREKLEYFRDEDHFLFGNDDGSERFYENPVIIDYFFNGDTSSQEYADFKIQPYTRSEHRGLFSMSPLNFVNTAIKLHKRAIETLNGSRIIVSQYNMGTDGQFVIEKGESIPKFKTDTKEGFNKVVNAFKEGLAYTPLTTKDGNVVLPLFNKVDDPIALIQQVVKNTMNGKSYEFVDFVHKSWLLPPLQKVREAFLEEHADPNMTPINLLNNLVTENAKVEKGILENSLVNMLKQIYGGFNNNEKDNPYAKQFALNTLNALNEHLDNKEYIKDILFAYLAETQPRLVTDYFGNKNKADKSNDSAGSETIDPQTVENVRSTLEISEDNVTSVFDGLGSAESVEMSGHNYRLCSQEHSQYLRGHVRDAAKAIRKFTMIQGTTDAISHGSANQARDREGRVTQRMIKIFKGIVPPSQAGLPYSMQELMAHEMDHLIWWSLDNADPLYQELRTIFYRFRNAYQNHPEAFMLNKGLTPNTAEYRAEYNAAVRRMEYILGIGENASEDPIREFATFALTNESMRSILSQVPGESTESNKPLTNFIRMIGDLFLKVINKIFGKVDNNKYKRTDNLLANVEAIRRVVMERMGSYREITRLNELASTVHHKFDAGDLQLRQVVNRFNPQSKINRFMATDFGSKLKSSKFLGELVSELNMDDTPQSLKRSVLKSMIDHVAKINKKRQQQIAVDTKYLNDSFKYKPTTIVSKAITEGLLRTDIQTLYDGTQASMDYIRNVIGNAEFRNAELERHKAILAMQTHNGNSLGAFFINSCNSLANFMVTGNYLYDFCNHSNTYQIARLWGHSSNQVIKDPNVINQYQGALNTYTTLKAVSLLPQETLDVLHESMEQEFLADNTNNGYTTLIKYHENALRKGFSEINDTEAVAQMHKGYLKDRFNPYYRVIKVYNENDYKDLLKKGFKEFTPPNALSNPDGIYKKYMYNTIASPNTYVSGAVASIDVKARGYTVFATDPSNKLVDYNSVKRIKANQYINNKQRERALFETITDYAYKNDNPTLNTVFNGYGTIMDLQESLSNDIKDNVLDRSNDFADALARTSAAYTEIQESAKLNEALFRVLINDANTNLGNVKEEEIIRIGPNEDGLGLKAYANLPLVTKRFLFDNYISERGSLPIRKSVFNQVFGFKEKTLVTLMDKEEVFNKFDLPFKGLHSFINALLGNKVGMHFGGYWRLLTALGKDTVVIKNFLTTFDNIRSNVMLLLHNGVPLADILKSHIEGYKYIANYKYNLSQQANLMNDLTFKDLTDPERAEIQRKLSMVTADLESNPMYNILRRGALTTIEGDESQQDYAILGKRVGKMLQDYHDTLINSNNSMAVFMRNALMLHGSTFYQIANDFASGSDAIAKWIMYKNDPRSKGNAISKEEAFLDASELFVNYDLPTNEWIHWANQVGVMNFTKFMFRICRPLIKLFGEHPARVLTYLALKTTLGALGFRMFSFDAYNAAAWNPQKWTNKLGQGLQGGMVSSSIIEELPIVNVAHAITH